MNQDDIIKKAGARRPKLEDATELLELISEGASLRAACREMGLHPTSTSDFLYDDPVLSVQYARAKEKRAEIYAEESLTVTKAAALGIEFQGKKIDTNGARVYLDAIKWATARMAPKAAPVVRFENLSDSELDERLALLEAKHANDTDAGGEG